MILIHDGYMIDPKSGREGNYDILIDGDKIVKIAEKIEPRGKVTRINAEGLLVAPGLVDVHVHFGIPALRQRKISTPVLRQQQRRRDHSGTDGEHEACGGQ